jgi:hypothetical protein
MADLFGDLANEDEEDQHILNLPKQLNNCSFISEKNPLFLSRPGQNMRK